MGYFAHALKERQQKTYWDFYCKNNVSAEHFDKNWHLEL